MDESQEKNLCMYDGIFSRCREQGWKNQEKCPHAKKSGHRDECLYHCIDEHCWNIDANFNARQENNKH